MEQTENCMIDGEEVVYVRESLIESGGFGTVFKSKTSSWIKGDQTSKELAVKWLKTAKSISKNELTRQFDLLMQNKLEKIMTLKHDCVIRYWAAYLREPLSPLETHTPVIIMEYANAGSLKEYLTGKRLSKAKVGIFTRLLLKGLDFLHSNGIIHTDLKPANVLLHNSESDGEELKIADLDDPILLNQTTTKTGSVAELKGTAPYLSPEMASKFDFITAEKMKVGRKTDIWSLGCVVCDMVRGSNVQVFKKKQGFLRAEKVMAFSGEESQVVELIRFIHAGGMPAVDVDVDVEVRDFISKCHQQSAELRPTAADLLHSLPTLDAQQQSVLLNSIFCKVKDRGDCLVIGKAVSHLFIDKYYSAMKSTLRKIVVFDLQKPLYIILNGESNLKTLLEGVYNRVAILQFLFSHNWSSECLSEVYLPNLVSITFWRCEDITFHKGHWKACPNLRVISFQCSSIREMEENFLNELPRLMHFGVLNEPLSESQIEEYQRIASSTDYTWLHKYLETNPALFKDRKKEEAFDIGGVINHAMRNERLEPEKVKEIRKRRLQNLQTNPAFLMKPFTCHDISSTLNQEGVLDEDGYAKYNLLGERKHGVLWVGRSLWTIRLPREICSSREAANVLSKPLTDLLSKHHPLAIRMDLDWGLSDEMMNVFSIVRYHIVVLCIESGRNPILSKLFLHLHLPYLLELHLRNLPKNMMLRKGCFDGFPKLRALWIKGGQFPVIEENIFLDLPQFQSIAFNEVDEPSADQVDDILWLRKFVQTNPQLLQVKRRGELWEFRTNGYYYSSKARESDEAIVSYFAEQVHRTDLQNME